MNSLKSNIFLNESVNELLNSNNELSLNDELEFNLNLICIENLDFT